MKRSGPEAPKSIPRSKNIQTLLSLLTHGTNAAVTNQGAARFDWGTLDEYHEGLLRFQVISHGGSGATPTAVGAGVTFTLKYAWSDDLFDLNDAPTILQTSAASLVCALPNANSVKATGTLTLAANCVDGDAFYINGKSYVFRVTPTKNYEIKIAATAALTATNIINALNNSGGVPGTDYIVGGANADVTAATGGAGIVTVTAKVFGAIGNAITTAEDIINGSWGAATLAGGSAAGSRQYVTDAVIHGGRYLYVWYDRDAFASANSKIDLVAELIRL